MLDVAKDANLLDIQGVCRSFPKGSGEELRVLEKRSEEHTSELQSP